MAYKKGTKNFYAEVDSPVRKAFQKQRLKRKQSNNAESRDIQPEDRPYAAQNGF